MMSPLRTTGVAALVVIGCLSAAAPFVRGTGVTMRVRNFVGLGDETGRLHDVEQRFQGWRIVGLHDPKVTAVPVGGVIIAGGRQAAGVFFRTELDPAAVFRFVIDGEPRDGSASIRLRFDGDRMVWRTLERGRVTLVLPQTRTFEALVYSDAPYSYELRAVAVEHCVDCVTDASIAHTFPGWTVVPYVDAPAPAPYVTTSQVLWTVVRYPANPVIELRGRGGATGVLLTRTLASSVTYRLIVRGIRRDGAPTLRIRLDDRPFIYRTLDRGDGNLDVVLPRASRIETLLYSDATYSFDIRQLSVERCGNCLTDDAFANRVRREAAIDAGDAILTTARKARDWVAKTVVFGEDPENVAITTNAVMSQPAWQSYVDFFAPRSGGVWCAGIARYYQQVLALLGIPSLTLDIGYEGTGLTHVTDVIDVREGERRRFYVFDPTFVAEYVDDADRDVDLASLLAGRAAEFRMTAMSRTILVPQTGVPTMLVDAAATKSRATCGTSTIPGVAACQVDDHNRLNLALMRQAMEQKRIRGDLVLTLLRHRVIAIHGSGIDAGAGEDLRAQLVQRGVTVSAIN